MERRLKLILIILLIILISIISFGGIFVQNGKYMKNILPEYKFGMDLAGGRTIITDVSKEKETIYYDKDGNIVDTEQEDGTSKEVSINSEEDLNKENYLKAKEIIEDRLNALKISEYMIRLNEENGRIIVQLSEDNLTDIASQFIYSTGKLTIEDEETKEILLDSSNLKNVQASYASTTSGTAVYLELEFNKGSIEKLKEISNTYISTTDEEGNAVDKNIVVNLDDSTLYETTFNTEITNGILKIPFGTSTDINTINANLNRATYIAILINNGPLPLHYETQQNRFEKTIISFEDIEIPVIVVSVIMLLSIVILIIRYKKLGLLATISFVGYIAVLLIAVRIFNLTISLEGISGIIISVILNYILLVYILQILKNMPKDENEYKIAYNKSMLSMLLVLVPSLIIGIVLCFVTWLPAFSFGTIIFWGIFIIALYNISITRLLFLNSINK